MFKHNVHQVLIAIDQMLNALLLSILALGGSEIKAYADETLSATSYRLSRTNQKWNKLRIVIDTIFFWQKDHCFNSYVSELEKSHLPPEYKDLVEGIIELAKECDSLDGLLEMAKNVKIN